MARTRTTRPVSSSPAIAVVVSRYNASVTDRLLAGAREAYSEAGFVDVVGASGVVVIPAPGSYELPALALAAARTGRFRGVVGLGCLIKGETKHDQYIASAVAHGLVDVTIATGVPCAFGVLTVDSAEQAEARAGGAEGNKGAEAMHAVLDAIHQIDLLAGGGKSVSARPGFGRVGRAVRDKAKRAGGRR